MAGHQVFAPKPILHSQLTRYSSSSADSDSDCDWRVRDMRLSANGDLIAISGWDDSSGRTFIDLFRFNSGYKEEPKITYSKEFSEVEESFERYVSFLGDDVEARLIVTCCGDRLKTYNTENGTRLRAAELDGYAECMTVRERQIYISLYQESSSLVVVYDGHLNLINTITLEGDHGWLEDITVIDSSRLFVCTYPSGAMMYSASTGSLLLQYTKPDQYSLAISITVSSELALVLVSWVIPTVITVHSLSDSHGSQVLFKFNHEDPSIIRINLNRLVMVDCCKRKGLISVYDMKDVLTYDNLKKAASVLLKAADCEHLSHFFALSKAEMKAITSRKTRVERRERLLSVFEERSIIQSSDITLLIEALDELNISEGLSAICKGYMRMRATRNDAESAQMSLPGPSHRSPQLPSNSSHRKRSNPCEPREEQGEISQKRKTSSFNGDEQAVLLGYCMQTVTQPAQDRLLPVPSLSIPSTPSLGIETLSVSVPPVTLQEPVVIPGLHQQPLQEISGLSTTPNAAVMRHQSQASSTNSSFGRSTDVIQSSSYDQQANATNTVPGTSLFQEQVTISTNPTLLDRESGEVDVGDHPIEWSGRDASHGQQTSNIGRFHQPWQNGAYFRYPNGIGASPGSAQSLLSLLNDTCNSTRSIGRQVQLPLTSHNSPVGGTTIQSQLQQTLTDSLPQNSVNASSPTVALTWAVPSPNLSLGSSIPQVYYFLAPKGATRVETSPVTQESEPTCSPALNHTSTSEQSNDPTNLAGNSVGCRDQLSSTPHNPSGGTPRATTAPHSQQQQTLVDGLTLDNVAGYTGSGNVASLVTGSFPDNLTHPIPSLIPDIQAPAATQQVGLMNSNSATQELIPTGSLAPTQTPMSKQSNNALSVAGYSVGRQDQLSFTSHDPLYGTLRPTATMHSRPQHIVTDSSVLESLAGNTTSGNVASAVTVSFPDKLMRLNLAVSSDISSVSAQQAGRGETSSEAQVSEPTSSRVQNQTFISEQQNVLPNEVYESIVNYLQRFLSQNIPPSSSMPPSSSRSDDGLSLPGTSRVSSSQAMNPEQAAARERLLPSERQASRQFNEYWESFSSEEKCKLEEYRGKCDDRDALVRALAEFIFTDEERRTQNCQGKSGLQKHDKEKLNKIRSVTFHLCPISTSRDTNRVEKKEWTRLQGEIDTANRHFRQELKRRENRN